MQTTETPPWSRYQLTVRRIERAEAAIKALRGRAHRTLLLLALSGLGTAVAGTLGARSIVASDTRTAATCLVPASVLALVTFALLVRVLLYGDSIRVKKFAISTEEEAFEVEHAGGRELGPFMAFSHRQMTRFECVALSQATLSHLASLMAAALGFVVLIAGAWVTFTRSNGDDVVAGAVMTAVGTALSGFLSVTFLRQYQITSEQMSYYYGQPLVNCYLLHAERLVERGDRNLGAGQRREDVQRVIETILNTASRAQDHLLEREANGVSRGRRVWTRRPAAQNDPWPAPPFDVTVAASSNGSGGAQPPGPGNAPT